MNKIKAMILGVGLLFGTVIFAQETDQLKPGKISERSIENRKNNFSQDLNLSEAQRNQIAEIRRRTDQMRRKIKRDPNMDPRKIGAAMQELRYKEREDISKILSPEQLRIYNARYEKQDRNYDKHEAEHMRHRRQKKFRGKRGRKIHHEHNSSQRQLAPVKE